jgi:cathepsin B
LRIVMFSKILQTSLLLGLLVVALTIEVAEDVSSNNVLRLAKMKLEAQNIVDTVNSKQSLWKAEVNTRFAYMDLEDKRALMGTIMDGVDDAKNDGVPEKSITGKDDDLPASFDSRIAQNSVCKDVISEIQDQSHCGSCWAVAAASTMSDRICLKSNGKVKVDISALDLLSCAMSFGCKGGIPVAAWFYYYHNGLVSGSNYDAHAGCKPYPFPPKSREDFQTPKCTQECQKDYGNTYEEDKHYGKSFSQKWWFHETDIRREIMQNGPVEAGFYVYEDFMHYKEGVYKYTSGKFLGGHAVRVIGWGEEKGTKYWLIANSWNTSWGENGLFKILRGSNECKIESSITFGEPDLDRN